ncbi:A disintegrin and metalloproteinase with thrombospondin motifs 6-like [Ostrea edulis]|uniref:A disintegrin and metalloproteinase with thrombospondin motifs 6-like n=1 Tax=Ostrea edulis TaxID=37623 RepID=UPI002094364A|nr:A disintegrin and metalloproteinase with thrombospondin motifs 6-like [Ostrea edulis]
MTMPSVLGIVFVFIAGCSSLQIHGNGKLGESTIRSLFQRSIENFEAFDVSTLQQLNQNTESFKTRNTRSSLPTELQVSAFGEDYRMKVFKPEPVLHPEARIVTSDGPDEKDWTGTIPDCFLAGHLTSHDGTVSLSNCDGLEGRFSTKAGDFHVKELPKVHNKHLNFSDDETVLVIAKTKQQGDSDNGDDRVALNQRLKQMGVDKRRRYTHSRNVVVEMAVYTDSKYTERFLPKDTYKRIELMILKYNGVQMEWSRYSDLGYNVRIQIKYIGFLDKNPSFYNMSSVISISLSTFCTGMRNNPIPYDLIFLHTGMNTDVTGRSYQSSACNHYFRCGVESSGSIFEYKSTAHEIGHSLGMYHDNIKGCTGSDVGLMGGYGAGWSSCSINDLNSFLQGSRSQCLFREDVAIRGTIRYPPLMPVLIGQHYSLDEVCEKLYGPNFHFRRFPYLGNCEQYSCANFNEGSLFGQLFTQWKDIPGSYCGTGKICFNQGCVTFAAARQNPGRIRPGGWGPWTNWYPCSRSCGTGLTYRRRFCNNPSPLNHPGCDEDKGYEARTCNPQPCSGDSSDTDALIKQRASETCRRMLKNNVINSTLYTADGSLYKSHAHGVCEVSCAPVAGHKTPTFTRFGLMPQGTPCPGILDKMDINDWPRRQGYSAQCLDGYCKKFGCDGVLNGGTFDKCGVCNGDGTSCDVVEGTFTELSTTGSRKVVAEIPVGAYNIQFSFDYLSMKQNYLEVYTKDGAVVLASLIGSSWIFSATSNPVTFADTYWYYFFHDQYLHTKGPLTEPAIIKIFQNKDFNNTGIHYAYSLPHSAKSCQGHCNNGGTFNTKLCACDCTSGFYGNTCSSRCNTFCYNGAKVDQSNCACQCNDHQTGSLCKCASGYTGINCTIHS